MEKYDVCVIGGGPSGYAAAMRAIDFGKKVVLVEKNRLGGAGVFNGALASKTMWEFSKESYNAKKHYNFNDPDNQLDVCWEEVDQVVNEALSAWSFNLSCHLKMLSVESGQGFTHERGTGRLISAHEVEILKGEKSKTIYAENIVVATGSSPRYLPNIPIDEKSILTSDGIFDIEDFPESLVILGAGVIGCEFATIFANFGKTKVHIIDKQDRILPFEDADISELVTSNLEQRGVIVHKNSALERMDILEDGRVEYELSYKDGTTEVVQVEKALVSVGRVPNARNLGLEELGIEINDRGNVVDIDTQTSVPNIYAVGDLSGHIALVNVGELEGRRAIERMYGGEGNPLTYKNVSSIMFLAPAVATVGKNEQNCRAEGIPYKVVKIDYSCIARAIAMGKTEGFFKIIVTNDDEMKVLGMRAVGEHASSATQAVALLIQQDMSIRALEHLIHPHPSIVEGIQECVRMLLGSPLFKSSIFTDKLKCYSWNQGEVVPLETLV